MNVLRGDWRSWQRLEAPSWMTIGVFDGVHRGHQFILDALRTQAGDRTVGVITFREHPATLLRPDAVPPILTSLDQRLEVMESCGVDVVAVLDFEGVRRLDPEEFVTNIVVGVMNAAHVAVGHGFRFGHKMAGDDQLLERLGEKHGFTVEIVEIVGGDSPVRSTAIRQALRDGDVAGAATMLGRHFQLRGNVVSGDGRGRQIGFPTANLELDAGQAVPGRGVYATIAITADGSAYPSVVNVGIRPTFGGMREVVEVHLLDQDIDLYGQQLRVEFVDRLRPERRFDGVDALVEQIERDVAAARKQLSG